jgi:hypothetical protein
MALDIIGPGFGRTGTSSMKIALEHLGFGPAHHMFEVSDHAGTQIAFWDAAARGEKVDWDAVFAGYRSQVDWPGARFWRELADYYPNAKVILTIRDPDEWFDSVQATIAPFLASRGQNASAVANAVAAMAHRLIGEGVFDDRLSDRAHATAVFRAHVDEVVATVSPSRLLVFNVSEGWEPLCAFLGVPVPTISFPKLNSSKQFVETWAREDAEMAEPSRSLP